ncbi:MAG: hypothetical protein PVG71_05695 [Anaerolineae bacterium]
MLKAMPQATIASFILRFTRESGSESKGCRPSAPSGGGWRGVIRHIQTTEEMRFARMEDALSFIARYVDIAERGGGNRATEGETTDTAKRGPMDNIR